MMLGIPLSATHGCFYTICGASLFALWPLFHVILWSYPSQNALFSFSFSLNQSSKTTSNGFSLSPENCTFGGHLPEGIIFLRTRDHSTSTFTFLRKKLAIVEKNCGYQHIFVLGNVDKKVEKNVILDAGKFGDILQVTNTPDKEFRDLPKIIKKFRPWITEKCGEKLTHLTVVNNVGMDGFTTMIQTAVSYTLNLSVSSAGDVLKKFQSCLNKASSETEDLYDEKSLFTISNDNTPRSTWDLVLEMDTEESQNLRYLLLARQDKLVNYLNYSYVRNEPKFCTDLIRKPPFIVIFTHSSAKNFALRQKIRETWGSSAAMTRTQSVNLFFLGSSLNSSIQQQIARESAKYHDIIQESFIDSYRNITFKQTAALKFLTTFCRHTNYTFALKTDDDIVLDIDTITKYMKILLSKKPEKSIQTFYCIHMMTKDKVPRDRAYKWYITPEEYPGRTYPPYCYGAGYLMSRDLIPALYNASQYTKHFWVDDVYFSGFIARNLQTTRHVQLPKQSPEYTKSAAPQDVLKQKRWLVHTQGSVEFFDRFWLAFQSRWNMSARKVFETTVKGKHNSTIQEEDYNIL